MARSSYFIPVFDSLPGHKKELALRKAMDWNGFESVGFLVWFWLQVAADFPNGELPGLDGLEAALRRVWKAAGLKPKRDRIQLIAKSLCSADNAWVDVKVVDEERVVEVHDWEDGAGMYSLKRLKETERKRKQRDAARKKGRLDVPGTDAECPADVPGEKEKEKENKLPPTPPQAGGGFGDFQNRVFELWTEECARIPVTVAKDNPTTAGVARFAKDLEAGNIDLDTVRLSMRGFLGMKYGPDPVSAAKAKTWNLFTVAKSPTTFLARQPAAPPPPSPGAKPEKLVAWRVRCDSCGYETFFNEPEVSGRPEAIQCVRPARGQSGGRCSGSMRVIEGDGA